MSKQLTIDGNPILYPSEAKSTRDTMSASEWRLHIAELNAQICILGMLPILSDKSITKADLDWAFKRAVELGIIDSEGNMLS